MKGLFIAVAFYITLSYLLAGNTLMALTGPASLFFLFLPQLVHKLFRIQLGPALSAFLLFFCTVAFQLGVALRWYHKLWYYDIISHFLSGIFFTLFGLCLFAKQNKDFCTRENQVFFQVCYALFFSLFIAAMWEVGEYTTWLLTGHDAQHHLDTGVIDTMEDIISALAGSLIMLGDFVLRIKRKYRTPFACIVLSFDRANGFSEKAGKISGKSVDSTQRK